MTVSLRALAVALALAALGGCSSSRPGKGPESTDPAAREAAALRTPCTPPRAGDLMDCYDASLRSVLRERGVSAAMTILDQLANQDETVRRDGHMLAHSIGISAYTTPEEVGATFRRCLPILQSGCYHGVIQAYFVDQARTGGAAALDAQAINRLCSDYRDDEGERWLLFQCVHGMGHGLTLVNGHDLRRSLAACDLVRSDWEREGCYGGVFMENIQGASGESHHGVGRPQNPGASGHDHHAAAQPEHAAHGDHAAEAGHAQHAAAEPPMKPLDPADPLYPCTVLEKRYLYSCYQMQTSVVLSYNRGDFAATARVCDTLQDPYRGYCYQSMGRDVSSYSLRNNAKAVRLCSNGDPRYQPRCHAGYVKNIVDVTADANVGLAYCRVIDDIPGKQACYRAVGEELWALTGEPAEREATCRKAELGFAALCTESAGVRGREGGA